VGQVAKADKFIRALRYAAAWNAGKVLLPTSAPWLEEFLSEHASFTGVRDKRDDLIDAAVAAFDLLDTGDVDIPTQPKRTPGKKYLREIAF
jgi:predicted phage terminase large subunit-like protein